MPETETPYARYSRVTTRRGTLRPLNCPLEPELMVAEFSGELPPDVAQAVREHIAICETCGAHAIALRTPYNLLSSLGAAPVPYVPDLREDVSRKAAAENRWLGPLRALGSLSRFSILSTALGVVLIGLLAYLVRGALTSIGAFNTGRTTNTITHVVPAAPKGTALLETDKVVTVSAGALNSNWQVAEVLVTDQRTARVIGSTPSSSGLLAIGSDATLPVAIAASGQTIYQLTSPQNGGKQALVAINEANGATRFILPLTQPNGSPLPAGAQARSLAIAPDGQTIYVGVGGASDSIVGFRLLVVSAAGKVTATYNPATPTSVALPAPTSSLPASAFPSETPVADLSHMTFTEAAHGALVISPDGQWLFDTLFASDAKGVQYMVVRRISASNGQLAQAMGIPGPFHDEQLAISPSVSAAQVYIVSGSPDAVVYVVDASEQGPTLVGDIALAGPTTTNGAALIDTLSVSPTVDGQRLYVTEDSTSSDGVVTGHTRWLLDTQGMGVLASDTELTNVGALLANASDSPSAKVFSLTDGAVQVGSSDLSGSWSPWLRGSDNTTILRLISSQP